MIEEHKQEDKSEETSNPVQDPKPQKEEKPDPRPDFSVPGFYPSQSSFEFDDGVVIDSMFDSANLSGANKSDKYTYDLYVAPDAAGTKKETSNKTWFYYRVKKVPQGTKVKFIIKNMNNQTKLLNEGLRFVYKTASGSEWIRIEDPDLKYEVVKTGCEVTFHHVFTTSEDEWVYFAYIPPWSYQDDQDYWNNLEQEYKDHEFIYFNREVLLLTNEKRRMELITITSKFDIRLDAREELIPDLFPGAKPESRPHKFDTKTKKYVFVSSRVHPGEVGASYILLGFLRFILDTNDSRAALARDNFVFCIVPMLNPDGVYRGHYRCDTRGQNLNRYYTDPSIIEQPTIYAAKQVIMQISSQDKLFIYIDLHAHASKKGCFCFVNTLDFHSQVEALVFPKLMSMNSALFEYDACDYSDTNLIVKEKDAFNDKLGAGRVAVWKETGLIKCYTLECNYAAGKIRNVLTEPTELLKTGKEEEKGDSINLTDLGVLDFGKVESLACYTLEGLAELGEAAVISLLEMREVNRLSRLHSSPFGTLQNLKYNIALNLLKVTRFQADPYLKKLSKHINLNSNAFKQLVDQNIRPPLIVPEPKVVKTTVTKKVLKTVPKPEKKTIFEKPEQPDPVPAKDGEEKKQE